MWTRVVARRAGALLMLSALLGLGRLGGRTEPADAAPGVDAPPECLFQDLQPAHNPPQLVVLLDGLKVIGWISGAKDHAGKTVLVTANGKTDAVAVAAGNSFAWKYRVAKETEAVIEAAGMRRKVVLRPPEVLPPSAFFIVDRPVYRPNQAVQFAAYLRQPDDKGDLVPVVGREVEVQIVAQQKQTTAAKLKLKSDDAGRIAGAYTFTDADPLDAYDLSIANFRGTARFALAEFRKSKVRLQITSRRDGERVRLRFEALDFLNHAVPGTRVQFTAQVVRDPARPGGELRPENYVYAPEKGALGPTMEDLAEDVQSLLRAGTDRMPFLTGSEPTVVAQVRGEVQMEGKEHAEYTLPLPRSWKDGPHAVLVEGVLVDANGREQRATQVLPLTGDDSLQLSLPRTLFAADEPIHVTLRDADKKGRKGTPTLVAQRLSPAPGGQGLDPLPYGNYLPMQNMRWAQNAALPPWAYRGAHRFGWQPVEAPETVRRTLAASVAFDGDVAELRLSEPGAYRLIAFVVRPDGTRAQQETSCIVHAPAEGPGLVMRLGNPQAGGRLRGVVHGRWDGARVLLTLRDSIGYRVWKTLQLRKGVAVIDEPLPADCRYGCFVDVQYADANDHPAEMAGQFVHVRPTTRVLTIETKTKPVVAPGEMVSIDIQVNRHEPVDLVVSVYDQSLLGIKPDQSVDVRSFYLADERSRIDQGREWLRRKLGAITIGQLLDRAAERLREHKEEDQSAEVYNLRALVNRFDNGALSSYDLAALLQLAGIKVVHGHTGSAHWLKVDKAARSSLVADLLTRRADGWLLHLSVLHDTVLLHSRHESWGPDVNLATFGYNPYLSVYNTSSGRILDYQRKATAVAVSGNAMYSASGQAMFSHSPAGAPVQVLDASADQPGLAVRRDFSDSAFWSALVRTDAAGKARVQFKVPDSLTNWQVVVTALSKDLHVGRHIDHFRTYKPIMLWPMLPQSFTEGDRVEVFASVHNRSDVEQEVRVRLKVDNGDVPGATERTVIVPPQSNLPVYWTFRPGKAGHTQLLMSAECEAGSDASLKRLPVVRAAAEQVVTASGFCKGEAKLTLPEGIDPAAASLEVTFVPSLAADLADTLDYLVDYPYGCVEQTMSRFQPAIQVAQVLRRFQVHHEALEKKLPGCVAAGIKRLLELQQPDGGWGWNGGGQTHEMMTPYALFGLLQAEKAGYSLGQAQGVERGLHRLRQFIDAMGPAQAADRVFCLYVWGHRADLQPEWWKFLSDMVDQDKLSDCALAMSLELAVQKKQDALAAKLAARLRKRAVEVDGMVHWNTAGFSRWADDRLEITAAALKALVAYDKDDPLVPKVLAYFAATKRGNRWSSTKDTAMIVLAMCDYLSRQNIEPAKAVSVAFHCNGGLAETVPLGSRDLSRKVTLPAGVVRPGVNRIHFEAASPGMMYRAVLRYWKEGRDLAPAGHGIKVVRQFWLLDDKGKRGRQLRSGDSVPRGAYVESAVTATATLGEMMRYVLVEGPRPSCCEVMPVDDRRFEQTGTPFVLREERASLVAYHHEVAPARLVDRCVLHAEMGGEFVVAPARVELMYQPTTTGHSGSFVLRVEDKGSEK